MAKKVYKHEMTKEQHIKLLCTLARVKGRVHTERVQEQVVRTLQSNARHSTGRLRCLKVPFASSPAAKCSS
jgi:hypothetical protein